jgi:hypothetical protein
MFASMNLLLNSKHAYCNTSNNSVIGRTLQNPLLIGCRNILQYIYFIGGFLADFSVSQAAICKDFKVQNRCFRASEMDY